MEKMLLLRYDTEGTDPEQMAGFLEKSLDVHQKHAIPATWFCTGKALEIREDEFRAFGTAVKDNPLFDMQDHSYSHVGVGYENGPSVPDLRADYERSFAVHERMFGTRPVAVARCGTSARNGRLLDGFEATPKARSEFRMLADLGIKMYNTFKAGTDAGREFISYAHLGRPDIMGFPTGNVDVHWMYEQKYGDPVTYITDEIRKRGGSGGHMAVVMHDWCAWDCAPDRELTHVVKMADTARSTGFTLATHSECYDNTSLWRN